MVWRFGSNPESRRHARVSAGVSLAVNPSGGPVGARVWAFFVEGSEHLAGDEFEALKEEELQKIGVWSMQSSDQLIPADDFADTVAYLKEYKPIVGFFANEDNASDM